MWSSIQPLPGVCSSGWFRKKTKRPPGASTRATSRWRRRRVDVLEHEAGHDGVERGVAERQVGRTRPGVGRTAGARRRPSSSWAQVGSTPMTVVAPPAAASRATCPSPHPTSSTRSAPASWRAASGRICSSYSGSAPSVKPSCHHSAWVSHRSRAPAGRSSEGSGGFTPPMVDDARAAHQPSGSCRGPRRRRRRAATTGRGGLEAGLLDRLDAAQLLDEALLAGGPEARGCRRAPTWSCACRAATGGR